jgi:hypothetical protein
VKFKEKKLIVNFYKTKTNSKFLIIIFTNILKINLYIFLDYLSKSPIKLKKKKNILINLWKFKISCKNLIKNKNNFQNN